MRRSRQRRAQEQPQPNLPAVAAYGDDWRVTDEGLPRVDSSGVKRIVLDLARAILTDEGGEPLTDAAGNGLFAV